MMERDKLAEDLRSYIKASEGKWHFDKRISAGNVITMATVLLAGTVWMMKLENRVLILELAMVEVKLEETKIWEAQAFRLQQLLDKVEHTQELNAEAYRDLHKQIRDSERVTND